MRNKMHSFAATPDANIPRSRFNMPCNVKFTGNAGKLIPFYVCEVLPGDTFEVSTSLVCRLQTLIHPLMDNMYLDTYFFYVPNRLVWDNWKHFCGEPNKAWVPDREWTVPIIQMSCAQEIASESGTVYYRSKKFMKQCFKDTIMDYMGIGLNPEKLIANETGTPNVYGFELNALPIRAYNKIYDDWFRDENLIDPVNLYTGDNTVYAVNVADFSDPLKGGTCYNAPKLHDYFTSALPQAQRGDPVSLSVLNNENRYVTTQDTRLSTAKNYPPLSGVNKSIVGSSTANVTVGTQGEYPRGLLTYRAPAEPDTSNFRPDNLVYNLNGFNLGITVNDLRMAFQVQKFMERSARGGARYIELIKSMFGVTSPDSRLQRSEYLGGHRVPINIHQVVNQTESVDSALGNTAAFSVTSDVHNDFIHSFTEHGFVIGICTVRYKHTYPQGLDRMWNRKTKFDYYWPVFANIGEQPIKNKEIYYGDYQERDLVFGYQEAWADYRYKPNRVMGEMRPGILDSLASWHLADYYTSQPILSQEWIEEDLAPIDRAIAVNSSVADQFLFDILINNDATRPMPLYSIPGLVDHF